MSYTPILNNWEKKNLKKVQYNEFKINSDVDSFLTLLNEWAQRNDYQIAEKNSTSLVVIKTCEGNFGFKFGIGFVCQLSNPIIIQCFATQNDIKKFLNGELVTGKLYQSAVIHYPKNFTNSHVEIEALINAAENKP